MRLEIIVIVVLALVAVGALGFVVVMARGLVGGARPAETFTAPVDEARAEVTREREAVRAAALDREWQRTATEGLKPREPLSSLGGLFAAFVVTAVLLTGAVAAYALAVPNLLDRGLLYIWGPPALWPTVEGQIMGERIDELRNGSYAGVVTFTYAVEERVFNEQQILTWRDSYAAAERALEPYDEGQGVTVYYPPILRTAGLVAPPPASRVQGSLTMIGILIMVMLAVVLAVAFRVSYLRDVGRLP